MSNTISSTSISKIVSYIPSHKATMNDLCIWSLNSEPKSSSIYVCILYTSTAGSRRGRREQFNPVTGVRRALQPPASAARGLTLPARGRRRCASRPTSAGAPRRGTRCRHRRSAAAWSWSGPPPGPGSGSRPACPPPWRSCSLQAAREDSWCQLVASWLAPCFLQELLVTWKRGQRCVILQSNFSQPRTDLSRSKTTLSPVMKFSACRRGHGGSKDQSVSSTCRRHCQSVHSILPSRKKKKRWWTGLTADDVEVDADVILHDRQAVTDHGTAVADADDRLGDRELGSPLGRQAHVRDQRLCLVWAASSSQQSHNVRRYAKRSQAMVLFVPRK